MGDSGFGSGFGGGGAIGAGAAELGAMPDAGTATVGLASRFATRCKDVLMLFSRAKTRSVKLSTEFIMICMTLSNISMSSVILCSAESPEIEAMKEAKSRLINLTTFKSDV